MTLPLARFVSFGEALTDMIRGEGDAWHAKNGGASWNVGRAAAALGVASAFAGCVSKDCFGDALADASASAGLDLRYLQRAHAAPLLAIVHQTRPPAYFFIGAGAADLEFDVALLPQGWRETIQWAHFGGISLTRPGLAQRLVDLAHALHQQGVKLSYDPNYRVLMDERYDATLQQMLALADVVKVSDEDLCGLYRTANATDALPSLLAARGGKPVLYTTGARSASLFVADREWTAAPPAVKVVDTVGAGDATIAGLVASLMQAPGASWPEHFAHAIACGSAACLHAGATPPTPGDIAPLIKQVSVHATT
ncbi:carbohydrate kinase [Niveibacterium umoris]|uniref:Fructokinase n=1 Tax=Niveibacterium umoris TaxID=1193620 RepID=A0A840BCF5_9RHOO|nr:carbohydrate kinase [Niveibacterium umoris]MBB4010710.1 fructokinase [Niveibacterium umoris]